MPSDPRLSAKASQMKSTVGSMQKKKHDEKAKKNQEVSEKKFSVIYFET
jgi:hypothetical protein